MASMAAWLKLFDEKKKKLDPPGNCGGCSR